MVGSSCSGPPTVASVVHQQSCGLSNSDVVLIAMGTENGVGGSPDDAVQQNKDAQVVALEEVGLVLQGTNLVNEVVAPDLLAAAAVRGHGATLRFVVLDVLGEEFVKWETCCWSGAKKDPVAEEFHGEIVDTLLVTVVASRLGVHMDEVVPQGAFARDGSLKPDGGAQERASCELAEDGVGVG